MTINIKNDVLLAAENHKLEWGGGGIWKAYRM